jgi:hypothetical protein
MKHLSKILLEAFDPPGRPMATYRQYLDKTLNFETCQSALAGMPDELLAKFYQLEDEAVAPKYFDFYKQGDVSKLESSLGKRIVILRRVRKELAKVHDRRAFGFSDPEAEVRFFELVYSKEERQLLEASPEDYDPLVSERRFAKGKARVSPKECLLDCLRDLLGKDSPRCDHSSGKCRDLASFCSSARILTGGDESFVLVTHVRTEILASHCYQPKNQVFAVLTAVGLEKLPSARVFSLTADGKHMYELKKDYADFVIERFCKRRGGEKLLEHRQHRDKASFEDDSNASFSSVVVDERGGCCEACSGSTAYEAQMPPDGFPKLYRIKMSSFDSLVMLGLFSPRTEASVLEACELSTASFDVESLTIPLDHEAGKEEDSLPVSHVSSVRLPRAAIARQVPILISWIDQLAMREGASPYVYEAEEAGPEKMVEKFVAELLVRREASIAAKRKILEGLTEFIVNMKKAHFDFFLVGEDGEDKEQRERRSRYGGADDDEEEEEEEEDRRLEEKKARRQDYLWEEDAEASFLKKKRHRDIARAWENSILGSFEAQLESLATGFFLWGFNCEASKNMSRQTKRVSIFV